MAMKDKRAGERQALERLLEVYGADRTRWPARERLRFAGFIGDDDGAKRLVAEAAALDTLLDRASRASEDRERALQERIVAAALRSVEPRLAVVPGVAERPVKSAPVLARLRAFAPALGKAGVGRELPAAALLAASLVVGVLLGSAGTLDTTVQEVAEVAGLVNSNSQLAQIEEMLTFADEDIL